MTRMLNPTADVDRFVLSRLDVATPGGLRRGQEAVRAFGTPQTRKRPRIAGDLGDTSALQALLDAGHKAGLWIDETLLDLVSESSVNVHDPMANSAASDSIVTFGTTLTTIVSAGVGPLLAGVTYLRIAIAHSRMSIDTTGFARCYARTSASSSSVAGERTGTVGGERSCMAMAWDIVTGTGTSSTMSARGGMDTATGYSSGALIMGFALPLGGG